MNDFRKRAFENSKILGCRQYVFVKPDLKGNSGEIKDKTLSVFRFDHKNKYLFSDKPCFFDGNKLSFWNLFDIANNLSKEELYDILQHISNMVCKGNEMIFDYPVYKDIERHGFSYGEVENMLEKAGFLIYEHLIYSHLKNFAFCVAVKE